MQIKCSKDIGAWFDELAIFNVKINHTKGRKKLQNEDNFKKLAAEIESQIGKYKYDLIIESEEYQDLYNANLETFKLVECAQKDNGLAKRVDLSNYDRFKTKQELQRKYFESELKEVKIGY